MGGLRGPSHAKILSSDGELTPLQGHLFLQGSFPLSFCRSLLEGAGPVAIAHHFACLKSALPYSSLLLNSPPSPPRIGSHDPSLEPSPHPGTHFHSKAPMARVPLKHGNRD